MARPIKRSVTIAGHGTSVSLEPEFWDALKRIAGDKGLSVAALLREVDAGRRDAGLSSAARIYALTYYLNQSLGLSENRGSPLPVDAPPWDSASSPSAISSSRASSGDMVTGPEPPDDDDG